MIGGVYCVFAMNVLYGRVGKAQRDRRVEDVDVEEKIGAAGNPALTYAVFTPAVGDWPLFRATGRPADMYAVLAI